MRSALVDSEDKARDICDELWRRYPGSLNSYEKKSDVWKVESSMDPIAFYQVVELIDPTRWTTGPR